MGRPVMRRALLALLLLLLLAAPAVRANDLTLISIGTGARDGTYYPVGRAICRVLDRALADRRIRCSVESTPGSVYNVTMLARGELDFALVQSDVQFAAAQGREGWSGRPVPDLRAIAGLYTEVFTILAGPDSGITTLDGLKGRDVNTGSPGSGTHATWKQLAAALAWTGPAAVRGVELRGDVGGPLCDGRIAASAAVGYQPSPGLRALLGRCATRLVPVTGPAVDAMLERSPYYRRTVVPAAAYGLPEDVPSFGASSDLVTTLKVKPEIVAAVARALAENAEELAGMSPALARFDKRNVGLGLTLPQHPAATAAFRGLGLVR